MIKFNQYKNIFAFNIFLDFTVKKAAEMRLSQHFREILFLFAQSYFKPHFNLKNKTGGDSESASELSTKQVETATKSSCSSSPAKTKTSTKKENNNSTNNDSEETEFITKLMNMLSDLSEEDMKSSTWVSTSSTKPVDFTQVEDFCVEFGQEILDLVMDQLVDELYI